VQRWRRRTGGRPSAPPIRRRHRALCLGRSAARELTLSTEQLRHDLDAILRSAIDAVHAGRLVDAALEDADVIGPIQSAAAIDVLAAGKAAAAMLNAFTAATGAPLRRVLGVGPARPDTLPPGTEWHIGGHPLPSDGSVAAAQRALAMAGQAGPGDLLLVLLSGGGSALMALPADGVSLGEKQQTARLLMEQGADIHELNTVRKHLSAIKGGRLAAACRGSVLTLAVSDVVGDDLSVIASGPTVPDNTTYAEALDVIAHRGTAARYPAAVVEHLRRGAAGERDETPPTGDPRLDRSTARVIGPQRGAIDGARRAAETLGYRVHIVADPITGEAREAAAILTARIAEELPTLGPPPMCIIAAGETTVTVVGKGRGGRNQEFAFALARALPRLGVEAAGASIGTDGIDGPTDAAGAIADLTTFARAAAAGIADADAYLNDNNTYEFFNTVHDLIRTGPTSTNVGDLQIILIG
jgi:hydroxypyruvate reductase